MLLLARPGRLRSRLRRLMAVPWRVGQFRACTARDYPGGKKQSRRLRIQEARRITKTIQKPLIQPADSCGNALIKTVDLMSFAGLHPPGHDEIVGRRNHEASVAAKHTSHVLARSGSPSKTRKLLQHHTSSFPPPLKLQLSSQWATQKLTLRRSTRSEPSR